MSKPPKSFLGVTVRVGDRVQNVTEVELDHGVNAGISLNIYGLNLIPVYEEHLARVENRYTMEEWDNLPYLDRVFFVALRRVANAYKNVQSEAEIAEGERKSKAKKRY